jgi:catechol 2,3-dioxygenase-like lactoylglutathione lyase family enzyme
MATSADPATPAQPMKPMIRHIGITTANPAATAAFFVKGFGFTVIRPGSETESAIVSDGYINVTLLKFQVDRYGGGQPGLHHFGIQVPDLDESEGTIAALGATELVDWNTTYGNREGTPTHWVGERKWKTPEGVSIDVNPSGWITKPGGQRGQ